MIEGKTVLGIVPARGGSKGVPRKNLRLLAGRPLLAWTWDSARDAETLDRVILSSEDDEIIKVGTELGFDVPFVRPDELAGDEVPSSAVIRHALTSLEQRYDLLVLLQPTCPLRIGADIDRAVRLLVDSKADCVVSVVSAPHPPELLYTMTGDSELAPLFDNLGGATRRQEMSESYLLNGAVYACRVDYFLEVESFTKPGTRAFVMPRERSIDIDDELDFVVAESMLSRR